MIQAGALDRRVTILDHRTDTEDDYGNPVVAFVDVGTVFARRTDVSDAERVAYGGIVGALMARFLVRSCDLTRAIVGADRLAHDGKEWEITGIKEAQFDRLQFLEITATTEA